MKPMIVYITCSILFLQNIKSQDSLKMGELKPRRAPVVRVTFSESQSMRVPLMAIRDSSIFVYAKTSTHKDPMHRTNFYIESNWDSYNYRYIESIKISNSKLRSWLIPVSIVAGVVAGAIIGNSAATNKGDINGEINKVGAVLLGGILGGAAGTLTGFALSSAFEKKYMINGDWKSFEEMKRSMNY
jgi:hypothetical protein